MTEVDLPLHLAQLRLGDAFRSLEDPTLTSVLVENFHSDPEACVAALSEPRSISAVKKRIKQADNSWIIEFFEAGGIDGIWDVLESCANADHPRLMSLLRGVECAKALLSHPDAVDRIIRSSSGYVKRLLMLIDLPAHGSFAIVKIHLLLLMSVIARHSEEGYRATVDAFDNYKQVKQLRHRFSLLVLELSSPVSTTEYRAVVMAFINYLIASCENIDRRLELRSSLNSLQLPEILESISELDCVSECLLLQIRIYKEKQENDEEQLKMPGGVDLNNHEDVFRVVLEKFFSTEHSAALLSVLHKLLLLERDSPTTGPAFAALNRFMENALTITEPGQADRVAQVSIKKLRDALKTEENRKEGRNDFQTVTCEEPTKAPDDTASDPSTTRESEALLSQSSPVEPPGTSLSPPTLSPEAIPPLSPTGGTAAPLPPTGGPGAPPPPPPPPPGGLGAPPPPPPLPTGGPGAPPPPPPPPTGGPGAPGESEAQRGTQLWSVAKVVLTVFQKARNMQPKKKMKKLNWHKIPQPVARKDTAIWHDANNNDQFELPFELESIREAVERFFHNESKSVKLDQKKDSKVKQVKLDTQIAFNINIMLNDLKSSVSEVVGMIKVGQNKQGSGVFDEQTDNGPNLLTHHVDAIEKAIEKSEKISALLEFDGDPTTLGQAERFIVELSQIPWYSFRVKILKLSMTFNEAVEHYQYLFELMITAFDELLSSACLKEIMFIVLLIGNVINGNTRLGDCYGFTITSLEQLTTLVANVSCQGTNFVHYLVTILQLEKPHLLTFPDELSRVYDASRLPLKEIVKEIEDLKEKLSEYKKVLEEGDDPPSDLAEQMNTFIPNADSSLLVLDNIYEKVKMKAERVAEYFCDERSIDDFIENVFKEIWKFIEAFQSAEQDVYQRQPIASPWVKKEAENKEVSSEEVTKGVHAKAAIQAITDEEIEVVTPPLEMQVSEAPNQDQLPSIPQLNVVDEDFENHHPLSSLSKQRMSLSLLKEEDELQEQPKTLSAFYTNPEETGGTDTHMSLIMRPKYNRHVSSGVIGYRQRNAIKSSLLEPKSPDERVRVRRTLSFQSADNWQGNLFGGSRNDVERILNRMAAAIRKDLDL